jgi:hypothetical protein
MRRQNSTAVQPTDGIARLDAFLNTQILTGPPEYQRRWWNVKCAVKRHLASLPPHEIQGAAASILRRIVAEAA